MKEVFDCIILGAGPAGLSASLVLGRSRRTIALFDNGTNRNRVTQESHGFITRDGIKPVEFKNIALEELKMYPSVHFFKETVKQVTKTTDSLFQIQTSEGQDYLSERIILATGIQEKHPQVPEISRYYGKSLFSCPYCDGWELRDQPLIIIAEHEATAYHMAKLIYNWSENLLVATNGHKISQHIVNDLKQKSIEVITEPIKRLHGKNGVLEKVIFHSGNEFKREGGFVAPSFYRPNRFAEQLGCEIQEDGKIVTSSQKNIYAAGEIAQSVPSSLMIAAAEGYKIGATVNADITFERF